MSDPSSSMGSHFTARGHGASDSGSESGALLEIETVDDAWSGMGAETWCMDAARHVLRAHGADLEGLELYIALEGDEKSRALNLHWRGKDRPTNVLSFPGLEPAELTPGLATLKAGGPPVALGDLVLCHSVLAREAAEQNKPLRDHCIHLVTHGVLHLLGYDHISDDEAARMEAKEVSLLRQLGVANPYEHDAHAEEKKDEELNHG